MLAAALDAQPRNLIQAIRAASIDDSRRLAVEILADCRERQHEFFGVQSHGGLFAALLDRLDENWRKRAFEDGVTRPDLLESLAAQRKLTSWTVSTSRRMNPPAIRLSR